MTVLFRLWLVGSACWVGIVYWAYTQSRDEWGRLYEPVPWNIALGVPAGALALGVSIAWALGAFNRRRH